MLNEVNEANETIELRETAQGYLLRWESEQYGIVIADATDDLYGTASAIAKLRARTYAVDALMGVVHNWADSGLISDDESDELVENLVEGNVSVDVVNSDAFDSIDDPFTIRLKETIGGWVAEFNDNEGLWTFFSNTHADIREALSEMLYSRHQMIAVHELFGILDTLWDEKTLTQQEHEKMNENLISLLAEQCGSWVAR